MVSLACSIYYRSLLKDESKSSSAPLPLRGSERHLGFGSTAQYDHIAQYDRMRNTILPSFLGNPLINRCVPT